MKNLREVGVNVVLLLALLLMLSGVARSQEETYHSCWFRCLRSQGFRK